MHSRSSRSATVPSSLTPPCRELPWLPLSADRGNVATWIAGAVIAHSLAGAALAGGFTSGSIIVERIGDGVTGLAGAAAAVAVIEYAASGGAPLSTVLLPSSGSDQVTDSASATSNGYLNVHAGLVAVPGYNSALGTASVASTNTKVATLLDASGSVASRTLFPTGGPAGEPPSPFSGNNFRSMIATGANTFYSVGTASGTPNTGGVWYYNGSAFTQISSTATGQPTNLRVVNIFGNQLYVSSGSGAFLGISSVGSGLPTEANQTATLQIDLGTGGSAYGFVMFDTDGNGSLDRAYVADERATAANGGINRFDLSDSAWTRTGTAFRFDTATGLLSSATASVVSIRGLTGSYDSATSTATLFATTTETTNNRLVSLVDTGTLSTSTSFATLATAGANYVFRGVDLFVTESAPTCRADLDGSRTVDGQDLAVVLAAWGPVNGSSTADFDGNGEVDGQDLAVILAGWGPCPN